MRDGSRGRRLSTYARQRLAFGFDQQPPPEARVEDRPSPAARPRSADDRGVAAQRMRRSAASTVGRLGTNADERLAFVRDVQRIDAQQLPDGAHGVANGHERFVDDDADAGSWRPSRAARWRRRRASDPSWPRGVCRRRPAPPRSDRSAARRRRPDVADAEAVAGRHDGHAVVADRAGDDDASRPARRPLSRTDAVGEPDAGGVDDDAVDLAAAHDLRVAGDDGRTCLAQAATIDRWMRSRSRARNPPRG